MGTDFELQDPASRLGKPHRRACAITRCALTKGNKERINSILTDGKSLTVPRASHLGFPEGKGKGKRKRKKKMAEGVVLAVGHGQHGLHWRGATCHIWAFRATGPTNFRSLLDSEPLLISPTDGRARRHDRGHSIGPTHGSSLLYLPAVRRTRTERPSSTLGLCRYEYPVLRTFSEYRRAQSLTGH